jgi:acetaldehyde dehydrogenase/alcohol dehydrogenase
VFILEKNYWFFGSPLICFGASALDFLKEIPGKKVFIVTDPGIIKLGLIEHLTKKLKKFNKKFKIFDEVEPDPREETVIKGAKICQEYGPDLIIGLGGGSSMDAAKAILYLQENPDKNLDELYPFNKIQIDTKLIAIPTTSGTGAETTWAIIITREMLDGTDFKLELASRELVPDYAIIDPVFTKSLPPKLTASTGFDAYAHVWEGVCSIFKNDFSDGLAIKVIELVREYLPRAYENGDDLEAREKMHNAACMAGLSFGNSNVMMGHSMGHSLGAVFHKPHGLTVGVMLPYVLQYALNDPERKDVQYILSKMGKMTGIAEWADDDTTAAKKVIIDIKNLMETISFPTTIKEMGITKDELEKHMEIIVQKIIDSESAATSPRAASPADYKKILLYAFDGKDIDF